MGTFWNRSLQSSSKLLQIPCIDGLLFSCLRFLCVFFWFDWGSKESVVVEGTRYLRGLVMRYRAFNLLVTSSNLPQVKSDRKSLSSDDSSIGYVKWICDFSTQWREIHAIVSPLSEDKMVVVILVWRERSPVISKYSIFWS